MSDTAARARWGYLAACLWMSVAGQAWGAQEAPTENSVPAARRPATHDWLERPWEWRYVVLVTDAWAAEQRIAAKSKAKEGVDTREPRSLAWSFTPSVTISVPNESSAHAPFSVIPIEFDKEGFVTSPHSESAKLRGRINRIQSVALAAGDDVRSPRYLLGFWFTGLGDASAHWAPAICASHQKPDAAQARSERYLYGRLFRADPQSQTFGCREWAYQLYEPERPYIDVTSYVPKDETFPDGGYVREFIGWARFGDSKPIIGRHGKSWICFHDCPGGDKPGVIPDIKAWAAKNGWPVPKPPTKSPTFPDPPATAGTYPK